MAIYFSYLSVLDIFEQNKPLPTIELATLI